MAQKTLLDAFVDEIRDIYDCERQLSKALAKMARAATSAELKLAFSNHLNETELQIDRLQEVFGLLNKRPAGKRCEGIAGIIAEGAALMRENFDDSTMDACLISAAQRAEHYEIAVYSMLVSWAQQLGHMEASELLKATLEEEHGADEHLTILATERVNEEAAAGVVEI